MTPPHPRLAHEHCLPIQVKLPTIPRPGQARMRLGSELFFLQKTCAKPAILRSGVQGLKEELMSKSLKRVKLALADASLAVEILELPGSARTAADAAREVGCEIEQIAKSIIFRGEVSDRIYLFVTSGGRFVNSAKAAVLAGEPLRRADAAYVRAVTGFAIGGVAPIAHLTAPKAFWDQRLSEFEIIYAAAGTPHHVFAIQPTVLRDFSCAQPADFTSENSLM